MAQAPLDPLALLRARFAEAIARAFPQLAHEPIDPQVIASKQPQLADFQCNAAMGLGKRVGMSPRDAAQKIVAVLDVSGVAEPVTPASIAGPGFINVRLSTSALEQALIAMARDRALGVPSASTPQTVVVDLMGVNLAKQMHVGHLRSPVIGDAMARVLERLGHRVIRQNHVGDWGLPIAMVTARLMRLRDAGRLDLAKLTLDDLDVAYRAAQAECQRDAAGLEAARRWHHGPKALAELEEQVAGATERFLEARRVLVDLQRKEPATYAVWQRIYAVTMAACLEVCELLGVRLSDADSAGESSYADELAPMVDDLVARGIAQPDQGALIVRLDDPPARADGTPLFDLIKEPCLIRKSDGGYLYATTDICAVRRRVQRLGAHRAIYAVDARQNLHLRQVFAAATKAGYATRADGSIARLEHAMFGSVLGEDGKPFKTRSGENVKLADLLRETFARAQAAVRERNPDLDEQQSALVARGVGIAALKYADLSTDRVKDYVFSFDRMLAFEGDTGPYLLNALVRIKSIFRKAAEKGVGDAWRGAGFAIAAPQEKTLALALLRYPAALLATGESLQPHRLCQYLFEVAGAYASFYEACPVLTAPDAATRDARLALCDLTARVLEDGLASLGIPSVDRM